MEVLESTGEDAYFDRDFLTGLYRRITQNLSDSGSSQGLVIGNFFDFNYKNINRGILMYCSPYELAPQDLVNGVNGVSVSDMYRVWYNEMIPCSIVDFLSEGEVSYTVMVSVLQQILLGKTSTTWDSKYWSNRETFYLPEDDEVCVVDRYCIMDELRLCTCNLVSKEDGRFVRGDDAINILHHSELSFGEVSRIRKIILDDLAAGGDTNPEIFTLLGVGPTAYRIAFSHLYISNLEDREVHRYVNYAIRMLDGISTILDDVITSFKVAHPEHVYPKRYCRKKSARSVVSV